MLSKRKTPGETHLQNSHKPLWVLPVTCWMLLEEERGPLPSPSGAPSSNQQLESRVHLLPQKRKSYSHGFVHYTPLPTLSLTVFHDYYLSKSTLSSFLCINEILNPVIIITTVTSHQVLWWLCDHSCCPTAQTLPQRKLLGQFRAASQDFAATH